MSRQQHPVQCQWQTSAYCAPSAVNGTMWCVTLQLRSYTCCCYYLWLKKPCALPHQSEFLPVAVKLHSVKLDSHACAAASRAVLTVVWHLMTSARHWPHCAIVAANSAGNMQRTPHWCYKTHPTPPQPTIRRLASPLSSL